MLDMLRSLALFVGTAFGLAAAVDPSSTTALAVAAMAMLVVAVLLRTDVPGASLIGLRRARGTIDPSALVAQSDPDTEGHARPRAPGAVTAA